MSAQKPVDALAAMTCAVGWLRLLPATVPLMAWPLPIARPIP